MKKLTFRERFLPILSNKDVDYKKETIAGITTFLTMAYIIAVNPSILSATGMPIGALVTTTCLISGLTTILMGLYANLPFALAPGMGLNAYFAYSVCLTMGVSWQVALTAVFIEGIIFILLSVLKVREAVVNSIPTNLKHAVTVGIGLFIAFIGFIDAGIIVKNDATLVGMGSFTTPSVVVTTVGLLTIVIAQKKKIKGSMLWGIVIATATAWIYALINKEGAAAFGIALPTGVFKFESIAPIAGKVDFSYMLNPNTTLNFAIVVFTFLFVDFFDTVGTLVGVGTRAKMVDENGRLPNIGRALLVDAVGTTAGALAGTSAIATFVESSTGISEGGRTGFTSVVTGTLFLIAMFFSPLFVAIPTSATAPALIYVGYLMMGAVKEIEFDDLTEGIPAFLTIALMPLTYSIGDGLTIGFLGYVFINLLSNALTKTKKKISPVMIVLAVIFIIKITIHYFIGA